MRQEEIIQFVWDEKKRKGIYREDWEKEAGVVCGTMLEVLRGKQRTMGLYNIIQLADVLGLELVVQDKKEKQRKRPMPPVLYMGERIESRKMIATDGLFPRIDLFETADAVLRFVPKPCDVYEISTAHLDKSKFSYTDHPYGLLYSYSGEIGPDEIGSRYMYK